MAVMFSHLSEACISMLQSDYYFFWVIIAVTIKPNSSKSSWIFFFFLNDNSFSRNRYYLIKENTVMLNFMRIEFFSSRESAQKYTEERLDFHSDKIPLVQL